MSMVQLLKLPQRRACVQVFGLGHAPLGKCASSATLCIQSLNQPDFSLTCQALILPCLSRILPSRKSVIPPLDKTVQLTLADPEFHTPANIDIILGVDVYSQIIRPGVINLKPRSIIAQDAQFGWVLSGIRNSPDLSTTVTSHLSVTTIIEEDVIDVIKRIWEIEEVPTQPIGMTPKDQLCEDHYRDTHHQKQDGRYVVQLPLRSNLPLVANETRRAAYQSLISMEKRFSANKQLYQAYRHFMHEYEALGHMEMVPSSELYHPKSWYLPHYAVFITSLNNSKLRVVFDASRLTSTKVCLNHYLRSGPPLQRDITFVLIEWRRYHYVFLVDIVKMHRQILMHPEDRDFQRILWRESPTMPPREYRLKTVTYGMSCVPFLALRTLQEIAVNEGAKFSEVSGCLRDNTYVDDILAGTDHLESAIELQNQLISLLRFRGFELGKWAANDPSLIPSTASQAKPSGVIEFNESVTTLGLTWNPELDRFSPNIPRINTRCTVITKRTVLSGLARLYNPLGWLSPISIAAKVLIQDIWLTKVTWDELLPRELANQWIDMHRSSTTLPELLLVG